MAIIGPGLGRTQAGLRALATTPRGLVREPDAAAEVCVKETGLRNSAHGADKFGLKDLAGVHWNLPAEQLYEYAVGAHEGHVVEGGAFCAETGVHTGRSPKDK